MGFYDAFKPLRVYIDEHLVPLAMCAETQEIVITGHSMGGALANLCLAYFLMKIDIAALVAEKKTLCFCTIGTPRVGNRAFCDSMVTMLAPLREAGLLQYSRIVCNLDLICTIPMYIEGFCHVCPPAAFIRQPEGE